MRDAICDGDVQGFDQLSTFAERHADDDLLWHVEDVGGGAHCLEVNLLRADGTLPDDGPYLWCGFLPDDAAEWDGPWLDGTEPAYVGGYRYAGSDQTEANGDMVTMRVTDPTDRASIADALDALIATLSHRGEIVKAEPWTAAQCTVCGAWVYEQAGPFGEDGDRTKPLSGMLHYVVAHRDQYEAERRAASEAGRGVIGIPYQRANDVPVWAILDTRSVQVEQAAQALAAEMHEAGVCSVEGYHEVCDANEAIDQHATEAGLTWDGHDLSAVNDVSGRANAILAWEGRR